MTEPSAQPIPPTKNLCTTCHTNRALILRPKTHTKLCSACFTHAFETEVHETITRNGLFARGETIAIGASGGKDSTVLAAVLATLNARHDYGVTLVLLSVDEGIRGYRDDALDTVRRNARALGMRLLVVGYDELYGGWTMDRVVQRIGKKGNCTYCGVFRRQALDRGAQRLGVQHVVTGHNADDVAETVLMNLLRGDFPRLSRTTSIVTSQASPLADSPYAHMKRSKPLKYAYEKEIVLYAHHKKLEYFSTECIYSPEAFRGTARALIKDLERIRPSAILDIVKSGEDMARLCELTEGIGRACLSTCEDSSHKHGAVARTVAPAEAEPADEEDGGACGNENGGSDSMRKMDEFLAKKEHRLIEEDDNDDSVSVASTVATAATTTAAASSSSRNQKRAQKSQNLGQCERCGYMSSQRICKACLLLEGLNKDRPKREVISDKRERVLPSEIEIDINALEISNASGSKK